MRNKLGTPVQHPSFEEDVAIARIAAHLISDIRDIPVPDWSDPPAIAAILHSMTKQWRFISHNMLLTICGHAHSKAVRMWGTCNQITQEAVTKWWLC